VQFADRVLRGAIFLLDVCPLAPIVVAQSVKLVPLVQLERSVLVRRTWTANAELVLQRSRNAVIVPNVGSAKLVAMAIVLWRTPVNLFFVPFMVVVSLLEA